jgi:CheY-like chemotaxis protein
MAERSETKRRKVLVVDDEPDMRLLLRMVFEKAGHEVVEAHNGRVALERVHESRPDVLITDRMMPVMTGQELIGRLHADPEDRDIPVVLVSANPEGIEGADAVLAKPYGPDEVLETALTLAEGTD